MLLQPRTAPCRPWHAAASSPGSGVSRPLAAPAPSRILQRRSVCVRFRQPGPEGPDDASEGTTTNAEFRPGPNNRDILQRRAAEEELRRKHEKELQGPDQPDQEGADGQERGPDRRRDPKHVLRDLNSKGARLDQPKTLDEVTRIVLEQQQRAQRRSAPKDAHDASPKSSPPPPAPTRRREVLLGRAAMVGFFMACFWEAYLPDHPSITAQVSGFTGLQPTTAASVLLGLMAFSALAVLQDVMQGPPGPPHVWINPLKRPLQFLGSSWGFIERSELFQGRLAMLGFAAAVLQEGRIGGGFTGAGPGPLAQVAYFLGVQADDNFYLTATSLFCASVVVTLLISAARGRRGNY